MSIGIDEGDWENASKGTEWDFTHNVPEGRQTEDDHSYELKEGSKGLRDAVFATSFPFPRTLNARKFKYRIFRGLLC